MRQMIITGEVGFISHLVKSEKPLFISFLAALLLGEKLSCVHFQLAVIKMPFSL